MTVLLRHVGRYKLDSTFLHLPVSEALEHLQTNLTKTRAKVEKLEEEKETCRDEMEKLKKVLYAKFGSEYIFPLSCSLVHSYETLNRSLCPDSINLERGD